MNVTVRFEILVLITTLTPLITPSKKFFAATAGRVRRSADILCNYGTRFECVCHIEDGNLLTSDEHRACHTFISSATLPALRLKLSHFGSLDTLSPVNKVALDDGTPVTYEYYFRFYIAKILTTYCLHDANRCENVGFSVRPDSVVITEIQADEDNRIIVDYTVARSYDVEELQPSAVVAPEILLAAVEPELQIVVPYPVVEHGPHTIVVPSAGHSAWTENLGLITALIIFACVLVFIYIIAIIKAVRDRAKISRPTTSASRKDSNPVTTVVPKSTQYGSTDHRPQSLRALEDEERRPVFESAKPVAITVVETPERESASETSKLIQNGPNAKPEKARSRGFPVPLPPTSKQVTTSRSLQLNHFAEKTAEKRLKMPKKAITCYFPSESQNCDRDIRNGDLKTETPPRTTGESMKSLERIEKRETTPNHVDANAIHIPVLIVPAMTKHRDDGDYIAKDYDNPDFDADSFEREYSTDQGMPNNKTGLLQDRSEEFLLTAGMNESGSSFGIESSGSSETLNSQAGSPSPRAFDVDYQPLRDSSWSVNKLINNEHDEAEMDLTE